MKIAVIASMKRGLEHFVARELDVFVANGCQVKLFPTKYGDGLYREREDWKIHKWNILGVLSAQLSFMVRRPKFYLELLAEAISTRAIYDFALACYFAPRVSDAQTIYATFGDHKLFVGYFCKRMLNKPLAVKIHAYELYRNPNPTLFLRALRSCDLIMTVTEHNKELLITEHDVPASAIEVVRISVDVQAYRPDDKFIVLIVAFFAERKGHDILFQAVSQLGREDIEVWVVGDEGSEGNVVDVVSLARELGIESQVAFFGKLSGRALTAVYRACNVFCLPCRPDRYGICEGFPTVLAEAMAFGKPVISTRHVEIPKIIDTVLVDENDVPGLAAAIERLADAPDLCRAQGKVNRQLSERLFSNANATQTLQLMARLSDNPSPGNPALSDDPALFRSIKGRTTSVSNR